MKLLETSKNEMTKDKIDEYVPHLKITEITLVHCNIFNNDYQEDSRVLSTFAPNKLFGKVLNNSPKTFIFLRIVNSEFL